LSPDGTKVVFPLFEKGNRHSSIWIKNLSPGTLQKVTQITRGESWDYFPNWMGDRSGIVFHHMSRTDSGRLESRIYGYRFDNQTAIDLSDLGPIAGIAYQHGESNAFAAWTAEGLKVFRNSGDDHLIVPMSWCTGRLLSPGTLTWNRDGTHIIFALFDTAENATELYSLSLSTRDIRMITKLQAQQVISISMTR
jgi:hypothetical protein